MTAVAFSTILGALAGLVPAVHAARLDPVAALRPLRGELRELRGQLEGVGARAALVALRAGNDPARLAAILDAHAAVSTGDER